VTPNPKLPGTIFTAAEEINKAGGRGLPIECDIRSEESVQKAVVKTIQEFGGIDIVINNG
jgi:citronellol/citronellal dehydrogenase